jgi:methionyl-tRNA formyltransferase
MNQPLKIIFMGTPAFAVTSLAALIEAGCHVVAVITAPDKPAGRGLQLLPSPVKEYATSKSIPLLQPEKLKNSDFLEELRTYEADLQVVVAFRMLPEVVWNMPPRGTFNLHASLLPQYRGAAPINWAIINGESQTGVTTFLIEHEIDTGKIIFQETEPIHPADTVGTLYERLMQLGAGLVVKTVRAIEAGSYTQIEQQYTEALKAAPKIFKETCEIDWNKTALEVYNFVRGLNPYPAAWTTLNGKFCKILKVSIATNIQYPTSNIQYPTSDNKTYLHFKCADGWVAVEELQLEGKKRMEVEEFLRGYRLK